MSFRKEGTEAEVKLGRERCGSRTKKEGNPFRLLLIEAAVRSRGRKS